MPFEDLGVTEMATRTHAMANETACKTYTLWIVSNKGRMWLGVGGYDDDNPLFRSTSLVTAKVRSNSEGIFLLFLLVPPFLLGFKLPFHQTSPNVVKLSKLIDLL